MIRGGPFLVEEVRCYGVEEILILIDWHSGENQIFVQRMFCHHFCRAKMMTKQICVDLLPRVKTRGYLATNLRPSR